MTSTADPIVAPWIAQAKSVIGPSMPEVKVEDFDGPANAQTKYEAGAIRMDWRRNYPMQLHLPQPNAADLAQAALEIEYTACHDLGHGVAAWLRSLGIDVEGELYAVRGFTTTPAADHALADAEAAARGIEAGWPRQPWERVAETMRAAIGGRWIRPERTLNENKPIDPMVARAWLLELVTRATGGVVAPVPPTPTKPEVKSVNGKGCDIASYQGAVNFDLLKTEVSFVIAKSSEGTGYRDPTFQRNWSEAKRVGLTKGAYHFARPDLGTNAHDEAAYFLSSIGPVDPGDLLALDYEVQWDGDVVGWCASFLNLVRQMTGITPLIYLNLSLVRGHDWSPVIVDGFPLWLAAYDGQPDAVPATPWPSVAIKQWTSSGTLPGVPGHVDLNTAFGEGGDMASEAEILEIIEKNYGLKDTVVAVKEALKGQAEAIGKLAANETLDDADVAQLKARIDKLHTI